MTRSAQSRLVLHASISACGFTIALPLAALAGVRGHEPTGPFANLVPFAGRVVGVLGSLVAAALMLLGAHAAVRKGSSV